MLTKFCAYPGCRAVIPIGSYYCEKHKQNNRQKVYDNNIRRVRDADITNFYHSPEWQVIRVSVMNRYRGLDLWSYYIDRKIVSADMIHHILPVRTNWNDRFNAEYLIPLSNANHDMIESLYKSGNVKQIQKQLLDLLNRWKAEFSG